jgi:hypothetical protein
MAETALIAVAYFDASIQQLRWLDDPLAPHGPQRGDVILYCSAEDAMDLPQGGASS